MQKTVSDDPPGGASSDIRQRLARTYRRPSHAIRPDTGPQMTSAPSPTESNERAAMELVQAESTTELGREIYSAQALQLQMLPSNPPSIPGYEVTGFYDACDLLAGDFFSFVEPLPGLTGLMVADVSGHGIAAAMIMSAAIKTFSFHARNEPSPKQVLVNIYRELENDIPRGRFITIFYAILNHSTGLIRYARAGHNPALLSSGEGGQVRTLRAPGLAIGLGSLKHFQRALIEGEELIPRGGSLLIYSDGMTEACNPAGEQYGEGRLVRAFRRLSGMRCRLLVEALIQDVHAFKENDVNEDDVTLLVAKRK